MDQGNTPRLGVPSLWSGLPRVVRDVVLFAVLAAPGFAGATFGIGRGAVMIVVASAACVVLLRRRWPIPTLIAVLIGRLFVGEFALAPLTAPIAVAIFTVAAHQSRRTALAVCAATVAAMTVATLAMSQGGIFDPSVLAVAAIVLAATAYGDAIRSNREYLAAVTERAVRAEQTRESEARRRVAEDRLRIARDLHDVVAHQIAVINLQAGVATTSVAKDPAKVESSLHTIGQAARSVLSEIGDLLAVLRADQPDDGAVSLGTDAGLDRLHALIGQFGDTGLTVATEVTGDLGRLGPAADVVAYRVIQEALTNAHKHGIDGHASVDLRRRANQLEITVDNRVSPKAAEVPVGSGHGLQGIAERVESVRGSAVIITDRPGWFRLRMRIPLVRVEREVPQT